jgi:hypothetical protein
MSGLDMDRLLFEQGCTRNRDVGVVLSGRVCTMVGTEGTLTLRVEFAQFGGYKRILIGTF